MSQAAKSSQQPAASESRTSSRLGWLDAGIIVAIGLLLPQFTTSSGTRRGVELMPWPDGLEYAASAMNLASGRGAVLHFGGYTYPSRYTAGYPLILEFFSEGSFRHVWLLYINSLVLGTSSVGMMFVMAR